MAANTTFVTACAWILKGRASAIPQTVELEPSTIKELIESEGVEDETSDSDVEEKKGLRGSSKDEEANTAQNPNDKFKMEEYDQEKTP